MGKKNWKEVMPAIESQNNACFWAIYFLGG
jgi:hypothetical protein